jgi:hypothetical protein
MNDEDLRDLFAGLALVGILGNRGSLGFRADAAAIRAYETADAMIEAKYKKEEPEQGITSVIKRTRKKNV